MKKRKLGLFLLTSAAVLGFPSFLKHFTWFVSGQVNTLIIQQRWDLVALNIIAFLAFLIPLNYRRKVSWESMGIYAAFIASLFIEMYGIPLTVYLSSTALSPINPTPPNYLLNFSLLGQNFGMDLWMLVGAGITLIGMLIIALGWYTIYNREGFVRSGIYSHSRHPQYLGIILIAAGWFIGWPTLLTTALFPALVYTYYKLSLKEEKEVAEEVGKEKYEKYREKTRMFI